MLKVPTYLAPSPIHGTGVYTAVPISEGTVVWEYDSPVDWEIPPEEMARIPEPYQTRLRHFSYLDESGLYVLCGDNAKFMNHSFEPNCDDSGRTTVAARDIAAHEELTCDYRSFDLESREGAPAGLRGHWRLEAAG
ncbi:MAG TPA: SET domain-containing protein-lysine N-methyltransferase [Longimicrobiales bacterium]|nr:SET domain-containing protein-lysine N-methyltransferase [Longimicrobiales bacterium]